MRMARTLSLILATMVIGGFWGCGGNGTSKETTFTNMDGLTADCEFDVVTFKIGNGALQEVHINGLDVYDLNGNVKNADGTWAPVEPKHRGARFSDILTKAGISVGASISVDTPVNCVARDNFDPLRTKLGSNTTKVPHFDFFRDYGYVYVGNAGSGSPLYPTMEGKTLIVDYNVASDDEVPDYINNAGTIASLGMFRWKMIEKVDDQNQGIIELDPWCTCTKSTENVLCRELTDSANCY